jgi:hypothetical protein
MLINLVILAGEKINNDMSLLLFYSADFYSDVIKNQNKTWINVPDKNLIINSIFNKTTRQ